MLYFVYTLLYVLSKDIHTTILYDVLQYAPKPEYADIPVEVGVLGSRVVTSSLSNGKVAIGGHLDDCLRCGVQVADVTCSMYSPKHLYPREHRGY